MAVKGTPILISVMIRYSEPSAVNFLSQIFSVSN